VACRKSSFLGDVVARELKDSIVRAVKDRTGVDLPAHQTLDQMVRASAKLGVRITLGASQIA